MYDVGCSSYLAVSPQHVQNMSRSYCSAHFLRNPKHVLNILKKCLSVLSTLWKWGAQGQVINTIQVRCKAKGVAKWLSNVWFV